MPTVSEWSNTKTRHGEKWPCTHRSPPGRLAWRSGIGGAPAAASERLCYRAAAGYMFVCECICMCVVSEGAQTRRLSSTSPSLAGWPGAGGGRGTGTAATTACFVRCSCSFAPAPVPCTWRMEVLGQAPRHGLLSQFLWPQSLGLAWMLRQRSWLLDVDSSLQFSDRARWRWRRGGTPPTDFLTLSSLSPPYSTPWPLPHLLLLQPSYARPSYARSWSPIYHLRL